MSQAGEPSSHKSNTASVSQEPPSKARRWYDHDPLLMEVLEIMRSFQEDVKVQAELFLEKLEAVVGNDAMEQFYLQARPAKFGKRWYDQEESTSKAVELLRVLPPAKQRETAQKFLTALKQQGLTSEMLKEVQAQQQEAQAQQKVEA